MAITVTEDANSPEVSEGDRPAVTMHFTITGTSSESAARTALRDEVDETYGDLKRESINVEPDWVDENAGDGLWRGTVEYRAEEEVEAETGDSVFSFDTGGGTQHITHSKETVVVHAAGGTPAPIYGNVGVPGGGAINVMDDGPQGIDITIPIYNFAETHYLPDTMVTAAYRKKVFELTGKTNNAVFKNFQRGEILFLGASGSKRGADDWEVSFRFAASPNVTGLMIGAMTEINKKGWEYLWIRYAREDDGKWLVDKPIAVYIERVYDEGDLSQLGIGT